MKYRTLGQTDLNVSAICFGPMRSASRQPEDDDKSRRGEQALRYALDCGVNFLHSSYEYGTRWMMERVLKDHPKRGEVHHVIKLPVPDAEDKEQFHPAKFEMRIDEALQDLHAERISVLQWMWRSSPNSDHKRLPLFGRIIEDVSKTFDRLHDKGKVGYLMTYPYTLPCGRLALESGHFAGLIAPFNVLETEFSDLFEDLSRRGLGFMPFRPLYQGVLTDQRADASSLSSDDRCAADSYRKVYKTLGMVRETFGNEIGSSLTAFAVRFALAHPVCSSVIVGLNTVDQVDGLVHALEQPGLPTDIVARVQQATSTSVLAEPSHARSAEKDK